jgi:hypothetical protein
MNLFLCPRIDRIPLARLVLLPCRALCHVTAHLLQRFALATDECRRSPLQLHCVIRSPTCKSQHCVFGAGVFGATLWVSCVLLLARSPDNYADDKSPVDPRAQNS